MKRIYEERINQFVDFDLFKNVHARYELDDFGNMHESFFELINGVEKPVDYIQLSFFNHKVELNSFNKFLDIFISKYNFYHVCCKASENNKTIIGYLDKNKNLEKMWLVKCNICGFEKKNYMRFFYRCKGCSIKAKTKTFNDFLFDANKKHSDKYIYREDEFENKESILNIYCKKCKKFFYQKAEYHLSGSGCIFCNESKGEAKVAKYLDRLGVRYERWRVFDGLVFKSQLKYDFYLLDYNILIEYDGEYHYHVINRSKDHEKNVENFRLNKLRDKLKDNYALSNNIPLLRIPYWDFDRIEELIEAFISENIKQEDKQLSLEI